MTHQRHLDDADRRRGRLALLVLVAMVVVFFAPFLLTGRMFRAPDLECFFLPGYLAYAKSMRLGIPPLWNPYIGCGEPFLADIERGVFYPPNLIYVLMPKAFTTVISTAIHVLLAAAGTYGLSRAWGVSRTGSVVSAVAFSFSSFTITRAQYCCALSGYAWCPVVLYAFALWLERRRRWCFLLLTGALCLQFLAGYPEASFFTALALGFYALLAGFYAYRARGAWRAVLRPVSAVVAAGLLAILLSMVQFLPTWEALQLSPRAGPVGEDLSEHSLPLLALFSLLVPSVYGVPGVYWAPSCVEFDLAAFYVGALPVVVFAMAIIVKLLGGRASHPEETPSNPLVRVRVPLLLVLFIFFFLYAMGGNTPFFPFLWKAIPLVQRFTNPTKCLVCVVLSLGCLAGIGMDWIAQAARTDAGEIPRWRRFLMSWGTPIACGIVGLFVAACLVNGASLGKTVLRRFFGLDSLPAGMADRIPWDVLLRDSLKLIAVLVVSALLLRAHAFGRRTRTVAGGALVVVAFVDLLIANSFLLRPQSTEAYEKPSPLLSVLRPEGRMIRFFERGGMGGVGANQLDALLPKGKSLTEEGPVKEKVTSILSALSDPPQLGRALVFRDWAVVDEAYNAYSHTNFPSAEIDKVLFYLAMPQVPTEAKARLLSMMNCEILVTFPVDTESAQAAGAEPVRISALAGHVMSGTVDPMQVALVDQATAAGDPFADLRPGRVKHDVRLAYGPNALTIHVDSDASGLLVVTDSYYPGWTATVNGNTTPIHRVNHAFRGVRVPSGPSVVKMTYDPISFRIGIAITLATFVVLLILAIRRPRVEGPPRPGVGDHE